MFFTLYIRQHTCKKGDKPFSQSVTLARFLSEISQMCQHFLNKKISPYKIYYYIQYKEITDYRMGFENEVETQIPVFFTDHENINHLPLGSFL